MDALDKRKKSTLSCTEAQSNSNLKPNPSSTHILPHINYKSQVTVISWNEEQVQNDTKE